VKAAQIDEEISRVVEEVHQRVQQVLSERRNVLDSLAHLLLEKEMVQGEELRRMLNKSEPQAPAKIDSSPGQQPS
jgi:cell division protease FtsH